MISVERLHTIPIDLQDSIAGMLDSGRRRSRRSLLIEMSAATVVAFVGGGILSVFLQVTGLAMGTSTVIGLTIACVGVAVWLRGENKEEREEIARQQSEAVQVADWLRFKSQEPSSLQSIQRRPSEQAPEAEIDLFLVRIDHISKVATVHELEDFGPGYVVQTEEGERIYLAGQSFDEFDESDESLAESIAVYIAVPKIEVAQPECIEIVKAECSGNRIEVDAFDDGAMLSPPVECTTGFAVLAGA